MPKMTAREAAEKLRKYYYPQESICARQEAYIKCEHVWEEYILILPTITNRPPIFSHDFETCFSILDSLIIKGIVKTSLKDYSPSTPAATSGYRGERTKERC